MRIISGKFKGRRFEPIKNLPVRPTTDFAKEALFNILENKLEIESLKILDLFAGTGNISFEFVSRGCKEIVCVDNNNLCLKSIQKIANEFEILEISTLQKDVLQFILKPFKIEFDLVFADPPFDFSLDKYQAIIKNIFENNWLTQNGMLVIEHSSTIKITPENAAINFETRKYGSVSFSFFYR